MQNQKNFIRKKENFVCNNCGVEVIGNGYTDHCPACLWGRHVDNEVPGDRASDCGGPMEPIRAIYRRDTYKIEYRCQQCGHDFRVWAGKGDNRKRLLELVTN